MSNDNRCVCCGAPIPEGRQVCPSCEHADPPPRTRKSVLKGDCKRGTLLPQRGKK